MAVDDILKKIRADAEDVARQIVSEGKEAADAVLEEAQAKIEARKSELHARAEQRAQEERNRITTLAKLSARRELLDEKQVLIDRVFNDARERISGMDRSEYRALVSKLLKDTVESGDEEVLIGEREDRIDQAFLDEFSKTFGRGGGLKLSSERRPIDGGFVLRSGRVETNCALETIIRDARERLETEIAGILFREDKQD
jgi:V/A-type H+-transporting ATPase subunit E